MSTFLATQHETFSNDELCTIAQDAAAPSSERIRALSELLIRDAADVPPIVVDELCRESLCSEWRNFLILTAETLQLDDEELRGRLRDRLYDFALTLRHTGEAGAAQIVHSVIRCYASMIAPSDADSFREFLEPPRPVETRLVTLQCVVHLFENGPPGNGRANRLLADRIHELAEKFLDRDWLVPGEKAAIGQNATLALAALGDGRLRECIDTILQLDMSWLTRQVAGKLEALLRAWNVEAGNSPCIAVQLVTEQVERLHE